MRHSGRLPNGQIYFKREKRQGRRNLPARMPSRKQCKRWRRMLKRLHMSAEEYQRRRAYDRWRQYRYSEQR